MKNLRKEFPVLSHHTYLNTAYSGLLHTSLLDFRKRHDLDFYNKGGVFRERQQDDLSNVRKTISSFFGNSDTDVILIPNFSLGLKILLDGLDKNKKVLLLDGDYPSINTAVIGKGFEVCYASINATLEQNIEKAVKKHLPDVFICSIVQYISGIAINLDFIKALKTKYPDMLIIADGTQFCGTKVFDFKNSGIDILGGSGYKWLLSGYGNGFFLFNHEILDQITPLSYINMAAKADQNPSYTTLQARFECGHLDTLNFRSLQHSLDFISIIGVATIENHLYELCEYATKELTKLHLLDSIVIKRPKHSSIFNLKGDHRLYQYLKEHNITTSLRGQGIRISFHFYNTIHDIEKLLTALHRYC
ncbi:aminotransferase class V-fold PLP-dependent enzyme [Aquimarina sp. I32.4]|uniref:aminotransferase class V-fold PLP-dependent enzyme n=1 Tax=Aquimarina sp. I32.4 TaxID=2053903 RepID=UPI000CDEB6F4|nr:aminotransferase class V-fold PLP-dependent enzyme [Aquimarina sp. I32.4]